MQDVFISKWDAAGNISWVKQLQGGAALSAGSAITVDAATNIFSTGLFNATVDFDGGSSTFSLTSMGDADIYVHKMRCGSTPQLTLSSSSHVICAGNNAVLTATGASTYSWNAAPGANTLAVAPGTTTDYTVTALDVNGCAASAKITQSVEACTGLSEVVSGKGKVYPNPAKEVIVVELNEKGVNSVLEITDAQGRVVFVNMTADWCVSCKANEKTVFARSGFREALEAADAVYMTGDYTDVDPLITAYLQRYKAVGVPLYVVYPRGGGEGRILPVILTPGIAADALAQAANPR